MYSLAPQNHSPGTLINTTLWTRFNLVSTRGTWREGETTENDERGIGRIHKRKIVGRHRYSPPFRRAGARQSQILLKNNEKHRGGYRKILKKNRRAAREPVTKYSPPFRRTGARQSQNIHHRFGALARASHRYSPPFRRVGARQSQILSKNNEKYRGIIGKS